MVEEEAKFLCLSTDRLFKRIFLGSKDDFHLLEQLLSECLDKPVKVLTINYPELPVRTKKERIKTLDCVVRLDQEIINIELDSSIDDTIRFRNLCYFTSLFSQYTKRNKKYDMKTKFLQIQFNFNMPKKYPLKINYLIQDNESKIVYTPNFRIIEFNMDKYLKLWYDLDVPRKSKKPMLSVMSMKEKEYNDSKVTITDPGAKEVYNLVKIMNNDEDFVYELTPEEDAEYILNTRIELAEDKARAETRAESMTEVALNMLKKDLDLSLISEVTGLAKKDIEELKKEKK